MGAADDKRSPCADYVPKVGDRIRVTKRGPIWLWWETAVVGGSWPDMREGWATLDKREKCGECGGPKERTMRFRFDHVVPADVPLDQLAPIDGYPATGGAS